MLLRPLGYTAGQGRAAQTCRLSLQLNTHGVSQAFAAGRLRKWIQKTWDASVENSKSNHKLNQFLNARMSQSQEFIDLPTLLFRKCWLSTAIPTMEDFRVTSSFPTNTGSLLPSKSMPASQPFCDHSGQLLLVHGGTSMLKSRHTASKSQKPSVWQMSWELTVSLWPGQAEWSIKENWINTSPREKEPLGQSGPNPKPRHKVTSERRQQVTPQSRRHLLWDTWSLFSVISEVL